MFSVPLKSSDGRYGSRMQRLGSEEGGLQQARSSSSPASKRGPLRAGDIESNKHTTGFYDPDKGRAARDSNVFRSIIGAPIVHPGTALPWSSDNTVDRDNEQSTPKAYPGGPICATSVALQENSKRKSLVETLFPAHAGGRAGISGPILRDGGFTEPSGGISNPGAMPAATNPFPKVKTVSLHVAKEAERQRIDAQFERDQKKLQEAAATAGSNATPMAPKSIPATPKSGGGIERTTSVKRKPVFPNDIPRLPSGPAPRVSAVVGKREPQRNRETEIRPEIEPKSPSTPRESVLPAGEDATWGAMRYSTNTFATDDDDTTRYTAFSNLPHPLRAPPREAGSRKADQNIDGEVKVLFINEIIYDHPALVDSLVRGPDVQEGRKDIGLTTFRYPGTSNGTQHGKYTKPVFSNLSLVSSRSKRQLSTRPLVSVHGILWIASISNVTNHKKRDDIRRLWNSRRGVDQKISEAPPPVTFAQEEESSASPIREYKHNLLWQPGDGPTQPAHSPMPPVTLSKSNKRHDSPLFLALPPATGSMWTAPASKSNPCPPRLWTPSSVTLKGLWSFNSNTPSLAVLTRKNDPLWSKHNTPNPILSTLATESRRTFPARPDVTVSMAGPLWTSSPVETQQPRLWKPLKKTDEKLWTTEGTTPPLSQIADLKAEGTPLWSKENSIIAPIFSDLSLNSLRSKRSIFTKNLPVVEEGLWTKQINLLQVSRATTGLWGVIEEFPKVEVAPKRVPMLWNKECIMAPIFAHLPIDSARSKKGTSSIALPVFTEPMWKKEVSLRAKPGLWRPTPKPTGLWDATAKTKTLAQMSLEKKAKGSPLWKKEGARRTTNAMPTITNTAVRLPDKTVLPKAVGGLWKPKITVKPAPQLWARRKSMKVEKQPVGVLLWARETASRTTEATPERTKVSFTPSDSPLPKVSGNLWQKETPGGPKGLWKPPIKTVLSAVLQPSTPLWSREKASRRTAAVPERFALVPKKVFLVQTDPPRASGALWKPKAQPAPNGLWVKPAVITTKPIAICTVLWTAASASRTTSAAPVRSTVPKRVIEEPLPMVSGNMWQKETPEKPKGLWKREIETVGAFQKTPNTPLWSREGAARTTTAIPECAPFVPKPVSMKPLEPAIGDLWQSELAEKEAVTLWKQKPGTPKVGVWNAEGTTPSLVEIKRELATKDTLWQRRSILAARGANEDIFNNRSSVIQKLMMDPIHLDTTQSHLWKPTEGSTDDDETSWMITNTPPTGTLSCTSTLSDISEISPTSAVGAYEPRVRTHSKNSSISSTSGLWQPLSNCSPSKKVGLWSNDETSVPFVNLTGGTRAERTPLPTQREMPLETFDSSHTLWQPEILCDSKVRSFPWCLIVPYLTQSP